MRDVLASKPREAPPGARLSIGALSRATGIPVETLRTWESRYGFPVPERKPSGHRVYPISSVPRLRRIAAALSSGHRAGQVVAASDSDLDALLASGSAVAPAAPGVALLSAGPAELLSCVEGFDAARLTRLLLADWARLGPLDFLSTRVAPAVVAVGEAWEQGRLEIRHEHFFSERVGDLLRSLRLPSEERASGPLVVLGSLPGESHALGLQMAALVISGAGCRTLFLGTEVPADQMVALTRELHARALALSVSSASAGPASEETVVRLRGELPRRATLLLGGAGAPAPSSPGIEVLRDLGSLDTWSRRLAS